MDTSSHRHRYVELGTLAAFIFLNGPLSFLLLKLYGLISPSKNMSTLIAIFFEHLYVCQAHLSLTHRMGAERAGTFFCLLLSKIPSP